MNEEIAKLLAKVNTANIQIKTKNQKITELNNKVLDKEGHHEV